MERKGEPTDRKGEASKVVAVRGKGRKGNPKGVTECVTCRRWAGEKRRNTGEQRGDHHTETLAAETETPSAWARDPARCFKADVCSDGICILEISPRFSGNRR